MMKISFINFISKILENDFEGALKDFGSYANSKDCLKEIYIPAGTVLRKLKEPLKAVHFHESILNEISDEFRETLLLELVKDYNELNEYDKSIYYLTLLAKRSKMPIIYKLWYEILLKQSKFEESEKMCLKYQKVPGKDLSKRLSYICLEGYEKTNNEQYLKKCLKYYPLNRQGRLLYLKNIIQTSKVSKILEEINFIFNNEILKSFEDIKNIEKDVFELGIFSKVENLISQKVASKVDNPIYYLAVADTLTKKSDMSKASEVLQGYITGFGRKNIIANKYFELMLPLETAEKLTEHKIYRCTKCGAVFENYHDICPVCNHIERFVFI